MECNELEYREARKCCNCGPVNCCLGKVLGGLDGKQGLAGRVGVCGGVSQVYHIMGAQLSAKIIKLRDGMKIQCSVVKLCFGK